MQLARLVLSGLLALGLVASTCVVWSAEGAPPADSGSRSNPRELGRTLFLTRGCTGCHSGFGVTSELQIGPDLTGLAQRAGSRVQELSAENYVRRSILQPSAYLVRNYEDQMPTFPLTPDELDALVAFLLAGG